MFKNMNDIAKWLNDNGYFLNTENNMLMVKTGKTLTETKAIRNKTITNYTLNQEITIDGFDLLIDRINGHIGNLNLTVTKGNIPITKIDMGIIKSFNKRNAEIKQHQIHKETLKNIDYVFTERYGNKKYYVIKDNKCIELNRELVDYNKNILQVEFISNTENALSDDCINEYSLKYDKLIDDFNNLKVVEWNHFSKEQNEIIKAEKLEKLIIRMTTKEKGKLKNQTNYQMVVIFWFYGLYCFLLFLWCIVMRDKLIEDLNPLLSDLITKAKGGRFQGKESTHKLRISYINALSNLLKAYNTLLRDKEIEELEEQIMELQDAINKSNEKKSYEFTTGN